MILTFHPTIPGIPGQEGPVPADWNRFLVPWSKAVYKKHNFGASLIQEKVNDNYRIYIWTLDIRTGVGLYPVAKMPTIALQFVLAGKKISCEIIGYGKKILEEGNYEMFYVPIGVNEAWFEPGFYESLHIELEPEYLEELIAIRPEIRELISRLLNSSAKGMPMGTAHTNYRTLAILRNLRACTKKDASLHLEMHKFILELLSEYFAALQQQMDGRAGEHVRHRKTMIQIKDHILSAPDIRLHTIKNISRMFGISQSVLKRSFKNLFQITVSKFVHQQVMNKAIYLLTTTDTTIDDIADELGYDWRVSFEQAFRKHFKYSPVDLRKDRNS